MVKLVINLRSKKVFFSGAALTLMYLIYHINTLTSATFITGWTVLTYYMLITLTAFLYWFPYQFNKELDINIGSDVSTWGVIKDIVLTMLDTINTRTKFNK